MESARLRILAVLALALALGGCGSDSDEDREPRPGNWDLRIRGMEGTAKVSFDEDGVLHARCLTDGDCLRVLGYFHASHRFFQMDLQRRVARGRLAELLDFMVATDVRNRALYSTSEGVPLEEEIWRLLSAEERQLIEAYSQGVNAWLEDLRAGRNGARLSDEYTIPQLAHVTPETIPDWEPLDTAAFARLMTYSLSASEDKELAWGAAFSRLAAESVEAAVDFLTLRPAAKTYTLPKNDVLAMRAGGVAALDRAPLLRLAERLAAARSLFEEALAEWEDLGLASWYREAFGSNNWVLAPSRTRDGKAILANDPHLMLSNPSIFYLAHLDAKTEGRGTLHVAGATFPGIPAVVIGRNERVAWGATVAYFDVTDVYVEELSADGQSVIFEGEEVPIVRKEVGFRVAGKDPHLATLEFVPHHGPILKKDVANRTAITVRWTGHEPTNELRAFLGLNRAGSVAEAREALRAFEVGAQNFVLADVEGSIGWYPHARIPSRPWASYTPEDPDVSLPPWMPLPGDGSAEWEGYLPEEALPSAFDPEWGYLATANQDLTGQTEDGDPTSSGRPLLQSLTAPGLRMARIVERIEAGGDEHTVESSLELQLDTHSLLGEWVVPFVLAAAEEGELSEDAERLVGVLREWNYTCPTGLAGHAPNSPPVEDADELREAQGCAAFHYFLPRLMRTAFGNRLRITGADPQMNLLVRPLVVALLRPEELVQTEEEFWSDLGPEARTRDEVLLEALETAGREIAGPWGKDPAKWLWGRVHTVTFKSEAGALDASLNHGPFAAPGGLFTVNVANPFEAGDALSFSNGASLRIVNELGEGGIETWVQLPGGRDIHRDSPFFGHLIENWLEGRPIRLLFDAEAVDQAATATLRVGW